MVGSVQITATSTYGSYLVDQVFVSFHMIYPKTSCVKLVRRPGLLPVATELPAASLACGFQLRGHLQWQIHYQ